MRPSLPIETERLVLRPFAYEDLGELQVIQSRPDVTRYLPYDTRTLEALEVKVARTSVEKDDDVLPMAVTLRENGTLIGELILFLRSVEHRQGEIGFVFDPAYHGRGYAGEAAEAGLRMGFGELGFHRICGRCDARNGPSARLMERLGMRKEAHLVHNEIFKGEWGEELVYAMLEDEWKERGALLGSQASR